MLRKFYTFKRNYFALCTCLRLPETDFQLFPSGASLLAPFRYQILSLVSIAQTWFFALQVTYEINANCYTSILLLFFHFVITLFFPNNECPEILRHWLEEKTIHTHFMGSASTVDQSRPIGDSSEIPLRTITRPSLLTPQIQFTPTWNWQSFPWK